MVIDRPGRDGAGARFHPGVGRNPSGRDEAAMQAAIAMWHSIGARIFTAGRPHD